MMTAQPRRGDLVVERAHATLQSSVRSGIESGRKRWVRAIRHGSLCRPLRGLGFLRGRVPQRFRSYGAWRKFGGTGYKDAAPTALTALTADAIGETCQSSLLTLERLFRHGGVDAAQAANRIRGSHLSCDESG